MTDLEFLTSFPIRISAEGGVEIGVAVCPECPEPHPFLAYADAHGPQTADLTSVEHALLTLVHIAVKLDADACWTVLAKAAEWRAQLREAVPNLPRGARVH